MNDNLWFIVIAVLLITAGIVLSRQLRKTKNQPNRESSQSPLIASTEAAIEQKTVDLISEELASLEIVQGPDAVIHSQIVGKKVAINKDQPKLTIGSDPQHANFQIYSSKQISSIDPLHCTIEFHNPIQCFFITAENSPLGTKVAGKLVTLHQPYSLRDGDVIELGTVEKLGAVLIFHTKLNPPEGTARLRLERSDISTAQPIQVRRTPIENTISKVTSVFFSYAREDRSIMRRIYNDLGNSGITIWSDDFITPGTRSWQSSIQQAIENTQCILVLLSPAAKASEWVNAELSYAGMLNKRIFTVLIEGDERTAVPFNLRYTQWLDLRAREGVDAETTYRDGVNQLIDSIRRYINELDTQQKADDKPKAFISYRRLPSAMLATLIAKELEKHSIKVYVDTRQQDGAGPFPERLLKAIEENDIFLCLLANSTFESDWVLREVEYAHKLGKPMIPIFQENYVPQIDAKNEDIAALLQFEGVKILDNSNIYVDEAINSLVEMIKATRA